MEFTERIRNEEVGKLLNRLKTKRPLEIKKSLIEDFNNKMKALKGQLKGTKGQGLVNFELFKIDNQGKVSKLKDVGFNPKKGLVASDEDLSKITKERADQLIKEGKKKILQEGYRRGFLDKAGKVLKGVGKVIKPIGYAFGANAVKSAVSQADEMNLDLSFSYKLCHIHRKDMFHHNWQLQEDDTPFFIKYGHVWGFSGLPKDQRTQMIKQTWNIVKDNYV